MDPVKIDISEDILKRVKKVKLNKKEVKFHIVDNRIVFDEPISIRNGERIEIETILTTDRTKLVELVKGVFFFERRIE